jgi:flagellar biosynthesis protein FlhG
LKPPGLSNVIDLDSARGGTGREERASKGGSPPGLGVKSRRRRIIAVGGGKGGIGKSMVSANMGVSLAQRGYRVVLIDADLGGANLHTCLGISPPTVTLSDFVTRQATDLKDVAVATGVENLTLIAGAQDVLDAANLKYAQKLKLLRHVHALEADFVILDLGAGTSFTVLDFFILADHGVLVLLPEPTSIENAYRFVKAAFFRRMQYLAEKYGIGDLVSTAMSSREGFSRTPYDFVTAVRAANPEAAAQLQADLEYFRVRLVVNQVRSKADADVGKAVAAAWKKFFGLEMDYLGAITYDDEAWRAVRKRRAVMLESPESNVAQALKNVVDQLLVLDGSMPVQP